jgi:hypothetical protein
MKSLTLLLTDAVFSDASREAAKHGTRPEEICSLVLTDHFRGGDRPATGETKAQETGVVSRLTAQADQGFRVADHFEGYPDLSVEIAQAIVDQALKLPKVSAVRKTRGIAFRPRFLHLEYLVSYRGTPGVVVSVYGEPKSFVDPGRVLRPGRKSYSRARILNREQLRQFLPFVRQAYERRYGKVE